MFRLFFWFDFYNTQIVFTKNYFFIIDHRNNKQSVEENRVYTILQVFVIPIDDPKSKLARKMKGHYGSSLYHLGSNQDLKLETTERSGSI